MISLMPSTNAQNLRYYCDQEFKYVALINKLLSVSFGTIRTIARIWHLLDVDTCKILMQSLVLSCIDYCNSFLLGTAKYRIEKLNTILCIACRVIYNKRKYDHIRVRIWNNFIEYRSRREFSIKLLCWSISVFMIKLWNTLILISMNNGA